MNNFPFSVRGNAQNYRSVMSLFVLGLFILLISPRLMSEGMFIDGLYYADVARNIADGTGSMWNMMFTDISPFYGHPPLAITMESILFRIFGDHLWVEKAYSLIMILVAAWLIVMLWRRAGGQANLVWMPLLLLVLNPTVIFCAPNNLLENTMMVFILLSALCVMKSLDKNRFAYIIVAGLFVSCAFFTKGPTGLYTLAFPMTLWVAIRRRTFGAAVVDTIIMTVTASLSVVAVLLVDSDAYTYMSKYFETQVVQGMAAEVVSSRFTIVRQFFERSAIDIALAAVIFVIGYSRCRQNRASRLVSSASLRMSIALILLTLCGVLPIMISTKQHSFYILTVYPFFSVALSLLIQDIVASWHWTKNPKAFCSIVIVSILLMVSGVAGLIVQSHRPSMYDPIMLNPNRSLGILSGM